MAEKKYIPEYLFCYPPPAVIPKIKPGKTETVFGKNYAKEINLYIHLPFCKKRCKFCGFTSFIGKSAAYIDSYLKMLEKEMKAYRQLFGDRIPVETVHLGGGTPTYLTPEQLRLLKEILRDNTTLETATEFACEASPETLNVSMLELLSSLGVNRLCIGVQTFDDRLLKYCNRAHTAAAAEEVLKLAREYIKYVDVDLIAGLPGQTRETWKRTLEITAGFRPHGISFDRYWVMENSDFAELFFTDRDAFPQKKEVDELLKLGHELLLEAGYERTSVSFHNLKGQLSDQHFKNKWSNRYVIGLGTGANGFFRDTVYFNTTSLELYEKLLEEGLAPVVLAEKIEGRELARRYAVLSFKLLKLDLADFKRLFALDFEEMFEKELDRLERRGLIIRYPDRVELTEKGVLNWVDVSASFYSEQIRNRLSGAPTSLPLGSRTLSSV